MKKRGLAILVVSSMLLIGCLGGNTGTSDGPVSYAAMRAELEKIPEEYKSEDAVEDGHVVIVHGTMASDPAVFRNSSRRPGKGGGRT